MWAIRSPKGFGIHQHLAEKRGTLLLQATFGHTVRVVSISWPDLVVAGHLVPRGDRADGADTPGN